MRDLRTAIARLNPQLPAAAVEEAAVKMARHDFSRSLLQHNQEFHGFIRDGVPVCLPGCPRCATGDAGAGA